MIRTLLLLLAFPLLGAPLTLSQQQQIMQGAYNVWPRVPDSALLDNLESVLVNRTPGATYPQNVIDANARFEDLMPTLRAQAALPGGLPENTRWSLTYLYDQAPNTQVIYDLSGNSTGSVFKDAYSGLYQPRNVFLSPADLIDNGGTLVSGLNHETYHLIQGYQVNIGASSIEPVSAFSSVSRLALEQGANTFEAWDMAQGWYLTNIRNGLSTTPGSGFDVANQWMFNAPGYQLKGDAADIYTFVQNTAANAGSGPFVDQRSQFFQAAKASGAVEPVTLSVAVDPARQGELTEFFEANDSAMASSGASRYWLSSPVATSTTFATQSGLATDALGAQISATAGAAAEAAGGFVITTAIIETIDYGFTLGANRLYGQGLVDSGNLLVQDPGKYALFAANEQYSEHVAGTVGDLMTAPPSRDPAEAMLFISPTALSDVTKELGSGIAWLFNLDVPKMTADLQTGTQSFLNYWTGVTPQDDPMYLENFAHMVSTLRAQDTPETVAGYADAAAQNHAAWEQMMQFRNDQANIASVFTSTNSWLTNEVLPTDAAAIANSNAGPSLTGLYATMDAVNTPNTPAYTGGQAFQNLGLTMPSAYSGGSVNTVSIATSLPGVVTSNPMLTNIDFSSALPYPYGTGEPSNPATSLLPDYKNVPGVQPNFDVSIQQIGATFDPATSDPLVATNIAMQAIAGALTGDLTLVLNPFGTLVTNTPNTTKVLGYDGTNADDSFLGSFVPADDPFWSDGDYGEGDFGDGD